MPSRGASDGSGPPDAPRPPGKPVRGPYAQRCAAGKHAWCRCKRSGDYPLCDGTHRGTDASPLKIVLDEPVRVLWCACGETKNPPFCDGTHSDL